MDDDLVDLLLGFEQNEMGLSPRTTTDRLAGVVTTLREWLENSQLSWREFGPLDR